MPQRIECDSKKTGEDQRVNVKDQIKIIAQKRQPKCNQNEWQDKQFLPYEHIFIASKAPASGNQQKSKYIFCKKIKTE